MEFKLATPGQRFLAILIDSLIIKSLQLFLERLIQD
jgi:hypothetical protein